MKKIILLISFMLFFVLSSFGIDCEYTYKVQNREYCAIMGNDYDLKSYKYNKKTNTYFINIIDDLMDSNSHETYKSPQNGKYITHLIHRIYYKNGKITIKCVGYITGDIKVLYENGHSAGMKYINTKTFMERPKSVKDIKEFENMHLNDYDKKLHEKVIKSMASNQ